MAKTFEEIDKDRTGPREGGSRTYDQDGRLISEIKQDFGKKQSGSDIPAESKPEKKKSRRSAPEPTGGDE